MAFQALRRTILDSSKYFICNPALISCKNGMSTFAPYYIEPVFEKRKLHELKETGEALNRATVPVKPPHPHETCSEFFNDEVSKFINILMRKGNKILARTLVEKTFVNIKRSQIERYHLTTDPEEKANIELDPKVIFHKAIKNCQPLLMLIPIKRGGVKYQVPVPVTDARSRFMAQQWIIEMVFDRDRKAVHFPEQLAWDLLDAAENRGRVVKKKQDLHKQCEANRAFAHYRWS